MTIEELIDLQEAGSRARVLGLKAHENPYLAAHRVPTGDTSALGDWLGSCPGTWCRWREVAKPSARALFIAL
ncbi:hypothetical protein ELH52_37245 [Rhizobium ruizarguesonis]|nr:hypothetical protein ELH52_37245 [Rhizobium ruizarguesonis]